MNPDVIESNTAIFQILRQMTYRVPNTNTSKTGLVEIAQVNAKLIPHQVIIDPATQAALQTSDYEIFFPDGTNVEVGDQLNQLGTSEQFRVNKVYPYHGPYGTVVCWASRSVSGPGKV